MGYVGASVSEMRKRDRWHGQGRTWSLVLVI